MEKLPPGISLDTANSDLERMNKKTTFPRKFTTFSVQVLDVEQDAWNLIT
jgi:hypothetical protein